MFLVRSIVLGFYFSLLYFIVFLYCKILFWSYYISFYFTSFLCIIILMISLFKDLCLCTYLCSVPLFSFSNSRCWIFPVLLIGVVRFTNKVLFLHLIFISALCLYSLVSGGRARLLLCTLFVRKAYNRGTILLVTIF